MELFEQERLQRLNDSEFSVYNYISGHLQEAEQMNIRELAAATGVSTTTILRFCGKLGCDGYKDFKYRLHRAAEKRQNWQMFFPSVIHAIQFLQWADNSQTISQQLGTVSDWCQQSRQVLFAGIGSSGHLASYGARLLSGLGITAFAVTDPFYPLPLREMEDTLLIALSVSGETPTIISMADGFKKKHAKAVSITNTKECTLAKMSDIHFFYYMPLSYAHPTAETATLTTQIPVMYLLESLMCRIHEAQKG